MTDSTGNSGHFADDMEEYLQTFLDETEEQLDDLVETMLALEQDSTNKEDLNEAFRLIHSIKGSAGMMGFDHITVLTHHLENRFERFRSGVERLNEPAMNLVLRCIDFLRQCNRRLRDDKQLGSATELLDEIGRLEAHDNSPAVDEPAAVTHEPKPEAASVPDLPAAGEPLVSDALVRMVVRFRAGLQLAGLKAQLIVARLAGMGEIKSAHPDLDRISEAEHFEQFEVRFETTEELDTLRFAADVDGVESIEFEAVAAESFPQALVGEPAIPDHHAETTAEGAAGGSHAAIVAPSEPSSACDESPTSSLPKQELAAGTPTMLRQPPVESSEPAVVDKATAKVAETMRVDIDRLDNLMNLAGELVVNRARFVQISEQVSPALRRAGVLHRIRDFSDSLRRTIEKLENGSADAADRAAQIQQLRTGLELMDEQSGICENGRDCFGQIGEAIDQLSRVSHSLQRGVLDTRMVPVAPLFNRFKRVVRDLSKDRGKKVNLLIRGEKTELDKRMIDELGDPLVHLIRNSIDHGLEPPDVRVGRGKPEAGTISLEASHSGNNVYVHVRDDGGGIDTEKIRAKLIANRLLSTAAADELSDTQVLDYIWHPGFSTAQEVTDVSGRGVGMDVVKTRISVLNGTIDVDSRPERGTTFTLRLPLTLAIINCLLVRLRNAVFSMPIDDVCEIVSVPVRAVVTVQGKRTFDARGKFIPLVRIEDVFHWHGIDYGYRGGVDNSQPDARTKSAEVVILNSRGKLMGLEVDQLLGSQDIVIKSLSENFINIRGLSGASILGDGSVCLMLDVGTVIDMATTSPRMTASEEIPT